MEANIFTVHIITPQRKRVFENVLACTAPGVKGQFQVLFNHAPLMSQIKIGQIKLQSEKGVSYFATSGGFFEVMNNKVAMLLDTCEEASEIDIQRASAALERAKNRLKNPSPDIDMVRAEAALLRATNRLRVAKKK